MKSPGSSEQEFKFQSPRQERIFRKLCLIGFAPAAYYRDACRMAASDPPLDSITHLLGHLFREIEGTIINFLLDENDRKALTNQDGARELKIRAILKKLGVPDEQEILDRWLESESLHKYAHRKGITKPRPAEDDFHEMIQKREEILDHVLHCFESQYAEYHRRLDELLGASKPTKKIMTEFRNYVPNNMVSLTSLFERLPLGAEWLAWLRKDGFFDGPADPEPDPDTGDRPYPRWPAGRYLVRMAEVEPRQVMDIILAVNDKNNPYVQWALIEAAMKMPPREAARLVPKAKGWLQISRDRFLMPNLAELVKYLARGGLVDESSDLVRELLSVCPFADDSFPASHITVWDYNNVIEKIGPTLVDVSGLRALRLFCDLLDQALDLACGNSGEEGGHDNSHTWRDRIEQNPDRGFYELQNAFVTGVRDASIRLIRNDPNMLSSVISELESRRWRLFHRLALHVLCEFPSEALELIRPRLKSFRRYDNPHFSNEYYRLARTAFRLLNPADRSELLTAVQAGPDIDEVRGWFGQSGQNITDEGVQQEIKRVVRNRLGELRSVMNESEASLLVELEGELGSAVPLVIPRRSGAIWGSSEPEEARELETMTVEDIVSFLVDWGPSLDDEHRSPDKVCRRLVQMVVKNPQKFAQEALRFQRVDPTYVRQVFRGFEDALGRKEPQYFTWDGVISLCRWVVSQGIEMSGRSVKTFYWDENWANNRREIVELFDKGLRLTSEGAIPFCLRENLWSVLEPLTHDPEPTIDYEHEMIGTHPDTLPLAGDGFFSDSRMRPSSVAINTVRCLAVTAVVSYGMWVRRNMFATERAGQNAKPGFDVMPEVREVLDYHLDPQNDSSIGIAYVYGTEFRSLYGLDCNWAEENKARIFSKTEGQRERGAAAWEGYILNWHGHPDGFTVLREQYEQAVEQLGQPASETGHFVNLDLRLGEHLLQLYLSTEVFLGSAGAIWERFFEKAGGGVVGKLMLNIGWELFREKEFSEHWLDKLQKFWDWRISQIATECDLVGHLTELKAFGAWFGSGQFDDAWALARLREVLEMNGQVESDERVINRLANLVDQFSIEVLDCAILLVRGVTKGSRLFYWREDLKRIMSNNNAEYQPARQKCDELASILLSKGFGEVD